jgi:hypothetical protein
MQGGPRFLTFLPPPQQHAAADDSHHTSRLLVASGQAGGGVQILQPFQEHDPANHQNNFFLPPLDRGESITAMNFDSQEYTLALGTSLGNVLLYKMAKYHPTATKSSTTAGTTDPNQSVFVPGQGLMSQSVTTTPDQEPASVEEETKQPLEMPSFLPELPALSLEASLLQYDETGARMGANDKVKSIFTSHIMCADPKLSCLGLLDNHHTSSMGNLANQRIIPPGRRKVASTFLQRAAATSKGDFLITVPISQLQVDLMDNHRPAPLEHHHYHQQPQQHQSIADPNDPPLPNPNKLLFSNKLNDMCYEPSLNHRRKGTTYHSQRKEPIQSRGSSVSHRGFRVRCILLNVLSHDLSLRLTLVGRRFDR